MSTGSTSRARRKQNWTNWPKALHYVSMVHAHTGGWAAHDIANCVKREKLNEVLKADAQSLVK